MAGCCRLCRKLSDVSFKSLFDYEDGQQIAEVVQKVIPINIVKDDELPKHICLACLEILLSASELQRISIESDKFFRSQFHVKREPSADPIEHIKIEYDIDFLNCGEASEASESDDSSKINESSSRQKFEDEGSKVKTDFNPRIAPGSVLSPFSEICYLCSFCDISLKRKNNVVRHMRTLHDPISKPFGCLYCNLRFSKKSMKTSHESSAHTNEKPSTIFCEICGASGSSKEGMSHHTSLDHDTCAKKKRKFSHGNIEKHIESRASDNHKVEKTVIKRLKRFNPRPSPGSEYLDYNDAYYTCNFCDKELKPRKNILRHIKTKHDPEDRPFGCCYCIERFLTNCDLEVHEAETHKDCDNKTIFFCDICGVSGDRKDGMEHHMIDDHLKLSANVDESFKFCCSRCRLRFKHKRSLEQHVAAHHDEEIKCDQCREKFFDKVKLQYHCLIVHEAVIRELFQHEVVQELNCCICNQNFLTEFDLSIHLETHRDSFDTTSCQLCQMQLKNFDSFVAHSKYHLKPKTHQCLKCLKIFPLDGKLIAHVAGHKRSEQPRPHHCSKCDRKFKTAWKLNIHDKVKHQNQTLFICPFCAKSLATASVLDTHIRYVHNREKELKFECKICSKKFTKKVALDRHETTHSTDRPHVCEQCGAAFKTKDGLGVHIKRHDGTYKKDIPCPQCSFKFHDNHRLQLHLLTHAGVKPYECQYCDRAYTSKGDLVKHLQKVHVGDAVYKCEKCPLAFPRVVELREHLVVHSNN